MSVLTDIKNRGVEDILIACMDGLTGFPDAVKAVFPNTHIQHCIVHMIRNSTKFVSYKDLKAVCRDLKEIYSAINAESGHEALEEFGKKWNNKYPMIQASWERNWNNLTEFFNYPKDIRRAIYTTNAIESLNFSLRKVTRNKSSFPDDNSIYKVMYLAIKNASTRWTMSIKDWGLAVTGDWQSISLQYYLTGVFPALINPCHLHTFYDRVKKPQLHHATWNKISL